MRIYCRNFISVGKYLFYIDRYAFCSHHLHRTPAAHLSRKLHHYILVDMLISHHLQVVHHIYTSLTPYLHIYTSLASCTSLVRCITYTSLHILHMLITHMLVVSLSYTSSLLCCTPVAHLSLIHLCCTLAYLY